jgi:hypothetical protein
MKKITIIIIVSFMSVNIYSQVWNSLPGLDQTVVGYVFYENEGNLIIGGTFYNNVPCPDNLGVAIWDDTSWEPLPGLAGPDGCRTIYVINNDIYVGGNFGSVTNPNDVEKIAYWDGEIWQSVGNVGYPNGTIYDILPYNGRLYIGGTFSSIGNEDYWCLVSWDGSEYEQVPGFNMYCRALVEYNGMLIAGGMYGTVATESGNDPCIAAWDGNTWHSILSNAQIGGFVKHMIVDSINNDLYVGGGYGININGNYYENIARYDGDQWHPVGNGIQYGEIYPKSMCMYHRELYVGGYIDTIDNENYNNLARWDGESFHHVGGGVSDEVEALYEYKNHLYVGGYFDTVGGDLIAYGIAKYYAPPPSDCKWLRPRIQTENYQDTFYLTQAEPIVWVNFKNNNAYAQSWEWNFGDSFTGNGSHLQQHGYDNPGEYMIQVTVTQDGCSKTAEKIIVVEDYTSNQGEFTESNEVKVFPNPAEDAVTIRNVNGKPLGEIKIFKMNSECVFQGNYNESHVVLSTKQWEAGSYFIKNNGKVNKLIIGIPDSK